MSKYKQLYRDRRVSWQDVEKEIMSMLGRLDALESAQPAPILACAICGFDGNMKDTPLKWGTTWAHNYKGKLICNTCWDGIQQRRREDG